MEKLCYDSLDYNKKIALTGQDMFCGPAHIVARQAYLRIIAGPGYNVIATANNSLQRASQALSLLVDVTKPEEIARGLSAPLRAWQSRCLINARGTANFTIEESPVGWFDKCLTHYWAPTIWPRSLFVTSVKMQRHFHRLNLAKRIATYLGGLLWLENDMEIAVGGDDHRMPEFARVMAVEPDFSTYRVIKTFFKNRI